MNKHPSHQFFTVTNHLNRQLDYIILKIIMKETALSAKELAEASHYSIREIQTELRVLVDKKIVIRANLPGLRSPIYYLNQRMIQVT